MATNNRTEFKKAWNARVPKQAWKKSKETEATRSLSVPEGNYLAQLTRCMYGKDKNGDPYFMFRFVISHENPKYDGQTGSKSHFLKKPKKIKYEDGNLAATLEDKLGWLAQDFQRLGEETKGGSMEDIDELCDAADKLSKEKPFIKISVKDALDRTTGKVDKSRDPTIYLNGLAADEEIPEGGEEEEEEGDEEEPETDDDGEGDDGDETETASDADDEEEGEESDEDEEEPPEEYDEEGDEAEEEEEEETPPKKLMKSAAKKPTSSKTTTKTAKAGQKVTYKGATYTVKSVANDKAVIMGANKKLLRNIPVASLK